MIMATIPERKRTITKEFIILQRNNITLRVNTKIIALIYWITIFFKKTTTLPEPLYPSVWHGFQNVVPSGCPSDLFVFLDSKLFVIICFRIATHLYIGMGTNWRLMCTHWGQQLMPPRSASPKLWVQVWAKMLGGGIHKPTPQFETQAGQTPLPDFSSDLSLWPSLN